MFQEPLARLAREFEACGIPYMVIDGQAVLVHGEPRLTRDIDIALSATTDELDTVLNATQQAGLKTLVENPHEFARDTWVLPSADIRSGIRVDLMLSFTGFEQQAMQRAVDIPMANRPVRVATAEDLVVYSKFLPDVRATLRMHVRSY